MKTARIALAWLLLFLAVGTIQAQGARPSIAGRAHPSALRDWKFWAGAAVMYISTALDAHSTCQNQGYRYTEQSPVFRGNTSCAATVGIILGADAFYTGIHLVMHRYVVNESWDSTAWRTAGRLEVPMIVAGIHLSAAAHNYGVPKPPRCPAGTVCPAGN